jgi:hypothetical protein
LFYILKFDKGKKNQIDVKIQYLILSLKLVKQNSCSTSLKYRNKTFAKAKNLKELSLPKANFIFLEKIVFYQKK